jgi:hypothetical protein
VQACEHLAEPHTLIGQTAESSCPPSDRRASTQSAFNMYQAKYRSYIWHIQLIVLLCAAFFFACTQLGFYPALMMAILLVPIWSPIVWAIVGERFKTINNGAAIVWASYCILFFLFIIITNFSVPFLYRFLFYVVVWIFFNFHLGHETYVYAKSLLRSGAS